MDNVEFKKIRKKLNLTQKKLGEIIGYKERMIINFEKGNYKIPICLSLLLSKIEKERLKNDNKIGNPDFDETLIKEIIK